MREPPYTSSPEALALHRQFVANVRRVMTERGLHSPVLHEAKHWNGAYKWLSDASGVPYRTVENLMTLSNQPTMIGAAAIARALGVTVDALLGNTDLYTAPSLTRSSELACIHPAAHLPGKFVCASCLAKWQSYQRRLNELYEARHKEKRAEWDTENTTVLADTAKVAKQALTQNLALLGGTPRKKENT